MRVRVPPSLYNQKKNNRIEVKTHSFANATKLVHHWLGYLVTLSGKGAGFLLALFLLPIIKKSYKKSVDKMCYMYYNRLIR